MLVSWHRNYIRFQGEFFFVNDTQEAPFQPPPMPATPESGKMLSIFLSDYVVNSLGYVLQNHHMMQQHLTSKDVRIL